jgi:hypothetical protein
MYSRNKGIKCVTFFLHEKEDEQILGVHGKESERKRVLEKRIHDDSR